MTKEELAAKLNGREYGEEMTDAEEAEAKAAGLVVLFGASDDLAEFRGAIYDEGGCYSGADIYIFEGAPWETPDCECEYAQAADARAKKEGLLIEARWCEDEPYSWTYKTEIPHATFDILEDGDKYCRGIVFELPR